MLAWVLFCWKGIIRRSQHPSPPKCAGEAEPDGVAAGLDVQQTRETCNVAHWKISKEHFVNPEKSEASSGIRRQQYFGSRSNIHYRPLLQDLKNALLWRSICRKRNLITLKAVQYASQQLDTTRSLKIVEAYSNASAWQQLL